MTKADDRFISARAVTSQFALVFDRIRGEATEVGRDEVWRIVSMQPLPLEYHNLMLSLDRRMRLGSDGQTNPSAPVTYGARCI